MANTKVTSAVIADNAVGIDQLNVSDGTNGQVLTTNGSGTLSFSTISGYTDSDVETYLDSGTSTPTFGAMNTNGAITLGNASYWIGNATNGYRFNNSADTLNLLVIKDNGNIGIGTSSPTGAKLHVVGGVKATDLIAHDTTGINLQTSNGTKRLVVDNSGNVGIGDTSPASKLEVAGTSFAFNSTNNRPAILASGGYGGAIGLDDGAESGFYAQDSGTTFNLYVGRTIGTHTPVSKIVQTWKSSGVGIGTDAPTSKLHVDAGTYAGYAVDLVQGGTGGGNHGLRVVSGSASSYTAIFRANAATVFYVDGSGNYYFSGSNQSDVNKKENIADITDSALDLITQLQPKTYNFIGSDIDKAGFIAQEMEQVIPRLVSGNEFDPDASDDVTTNPTGKGIDYMGYTAYLTKAIQELKVELDAAKARIETLENA